MKYELTDETIETFGHTLHRIKALRDFGGVKVGDLGGFIEKEANLAQCDNAWVYDNAKVYDNARVCGDTWVCGDARVYGNAEVYGYAKVYDNARICGDTLVYGNARVYGDTWVYGNAKVCGNAEVYGDARVYGDAKVSGDAWICGNAKVSNLCGYAVFMNWWSSGQWFTYTLSNKMWRVGCFYGTGAELIKKAYTDSELSGRCYEAIVKATEAIEIEVARCESEVAKCLS